MKSILSSFILFLFISQSIIAQDENPEKLSTPGEASGVNINSSKLVSKENQLIKLQERIDQKSEKIHSLYFIKKEVSLEYGAYSNGGTKITTTEVKKHIYKAAQILIEDKKSRIDLLELDDTINKLTLLTEINLIQNQLIFYSGQKNTRPIEKQLKKLKDPKVISLIFFQER